MGSAYEAVACERERDEKGRRERRVEGDMEVSS